MVSVFQTFVLRRSSSQGECSGNVHLCFNVVKLLHLSSSIIPLPQLSPYLLPPQTHIRSCSLSFLNFLLDSFLLSRSSQLSFALNLPLFLFPSSIRLLSSASSYPLLHAFPPLTLSCDITFSPILPLPALFLSRISLYFFLSSSCFRSFFFALSHVHSLPHSSLNLFLTLALTLSPSFSQSLFPTLSRSPSHSPALLLSPLSPLPLTLTFHLSLIHVQSAPPTFSLSISPFSHSHSLSLSLTIPISLSKFLVLSLTLTLAFSLSSHFLSRSLHLPSLSLSSSFWCPHYLSNTPFSVTPSLFLSLSLSLNFFSPFAPFLSISFSLCHPCILVLYLI